MLSRLARISLSVPSPLRAGQCVGLAALALLACNNTLQTAVANGDTRSLTLRHNHRDDEITVTFKRDGKYDEEGLKHSMAWVRHHDRYTEGYVVDATAEYQEPKKADAGCCSG